MLATLLTSLLLSLSAPHATAPRPLALQQSGGGVDLLSFVRVPRMEAERIVEARITAGIFQRDPWVQRERGLLGKPLTLGMHGTAGQDIWRAYVDQRRAEFGTIGSPRNDPGDRIAWKWIKGWLSAEATLTRTRSLEQMDPLDYVRRVERTIAALVDTDRPSSEERALELNAVLVALPAFWEEARRSLVDTRRVFANSAIAALHSLEAWMSTIAGRFADSTWDRTFALLFDQHLRRAVRTTEEFREWLAGSLFEMENYQGSLDRLRWESLASAYTGRSLDADDVHERVLQETSSLLMTLPVEDPVPTTDRELLGAELVRGSNDGWERARAAGLFEGDLAIRLVPRWTGVRGGVAPPVHLANPRNDSIELHQAIAASSDTLHPGVHRWRRTPEGQRVLGLRYGAIGEAWLVSIYVRQSAEGERLWNPATRGGLGLYATDWALRLGGESNPLGNDPAVVRASLECRIEEALLLLAAIELHALEISLDRVAESLAHRGGISRGSAEYLTEQALRDPLIGLSFLAYESLRHWEAELTSSTSLESALTTIYQRVEAYPTARLDDLRLAGRNAR